MYIRCSNCGRILTNDSEQFDKEKNKLLNDTKMSKKDKEHTYSALLYKHGYTRMCCRMVKMGEFPLHEILTEII